MATINNNVMNINGPLLHKRGTTAALEASDYVPAPGEIIIATDNGRIKAGDGIHTWGELPAYDETTINNNLTTQVAGTALDAAQGYALNGRLEAVESITSIDCGEITLEAEPDNNGD